MRKGQFGVRCKTGQKHNLKSPHLRNSNGDGGIERDYFAEGFASVSNIPNPPPLSIKIRNAGIDIPLVGRMIGEIPIQEEVHDDPIPNQESNKNNAEINDVEEIEDFVENEDFPALKTRTSPKILVEAMKKLNPVQRKAVEEIGFGSILNLDITSLPHKLCYWVLKNFDPRSSELNLLKGRSIHVVPEDVHVTLGLPMGEKTMHKEETYDQSSLRATWESFFSKPKDKILPSEVCTQMLAESDGDVWFKRHFLVLVTSCLIETSNSGYVLPQIMDHLTDVDDVSNLNWCEYTLKRLVSGRRDWDPSKTNTFRGPILFLTVMYCDRVMLFNRVVPRAFPSITGWNQTLLRNREKQEIISNGFGAGYPFERLKVPEKKNNPEAITPPRPPKKKSKIALVENKMQAFTDKLLGKAKLMAETMSEIMEMVQDTPEGLRSDAKFVRILSATQQLLGCSEEVVAPANPTQDNAWPEELGDDDFWAERMSIIENIEKCFHRKMMYTTGLNDCPSFSLGLTQDEIFQGRNTENDNGMNTASELNPPTDDTTQCGPLLDPPSSNCPKKMQNTNLLAKKDRVTLTGSSTKLSLIESVGEKNKEMGPGRMTGKNLASTCAIVEEEPSNVANDHTLSVLKRKKVGAEQQPHQMVRRNAALMKKTVSFASPYMKRTITATEKLDKLEKDLFYWVLCNEKADKEEIVFSNGRSDLRRREMVTIAPTSYVSSAVLDVWSQILNNKEKYRATSSPCRFFATTDPCCYTLVDPPNGWDKKKCRNKFFEKLYEELTQAEGMELAKIDMFVFPIYQSEHFYVMAFSLQKCEATLIDNSKAFDLMSIDEAYHNIPALLKENLSAFLKQYGQSKKAASLNKVPITRFKMKWRDDDNKCDCAIYAMRHMETYMGPGRKWEVGLKSRSGNQMAFLRAKYCAAILTAEQNVYKDHNQDTADLYFRCSSKECEIDVVDILINQHYGTPV